MSDKILFSIPDFFFLYDLNMMLIQLKQQEPTKFYDDVVIDSVYGSFPNCAWNSGRGVYGWSSIENIIGTVESFNKLGISIRYTFTNSELTEEHLHNYQCNRILETTGKLVEGIRNGVNVNKDILAKYIEEKYPEFYLIWSTTKGSPKTTVEDTNELSKDRLTVAYYGLNNTTALEQLTHPENIEILVSEACIPYCPKRHEHYLSISKAQLLLPSEEFRCPYGCEQYFYYEVAAKRPHYVDMRDIREVYLPLGINKFKISGRADSPINVIENYVNYFVKPEYRDDIRNKMLISYWNMKH